MKVFTMKEVKINYTRTPAGKKKSFLSDSVASLIIFGVLLCVSFLLLNYSRQTPSSYKLHGMSTSAQYFAVDNKMSMPFPFEAENFL